jgi:heme o synthase
VPGTLLLQKRLGAGVAGLAFVTWLLLIFGSTVRVHGAGLACPDWPLCFGELVPELDFSIFLEWGHRVLAGAVSVGFLAVAALVVARRPLRAAFGPHLLLMALVLASQIVLGGLTVLKLLAFWSVTLHLLFGNAFMALMIALAVRLRATAPPRPLPPWVSRLGWTLGLAVVLQLALGGLVSSNYAGLACREWPSCNDGAWFPSFAGLVGIQVLHRLGAYTVLGLALALVYVSRGTVAAGRAWTLLALVLLQVALGVANVWARMPVELAVAHAATAHAIVATTTLLLVRLPFPGAIAASMPLAAQLKLWWDMTRPRVLLLVLFTGLPVFGMAGETLPSLGKVAAVLFGTALAGAASSTLNAWLERDTDAQMARTRNRPLPAAAVQPHHAAVLGVALTVASTAFLWWIGGPFPAAVGLATILFYVVIYTLWLKPRTPQNIVIGGAAGATTPIIAEAALTGQVTWASLLLFAIVFLWTPPHFWAIAIFRKDEYAAAGFPMMPNVVGNVSTRRQSLVYAILLTLVSVLPSALGLLSWLYGGLALVVGAWFCAWVVRSMRADDPKVDYQVFRVSIVYLFAIFGAMLLDQAWYRLLPALTA